MPLLNLVLLVMLAQVARAAGNGDSCWFAGPRSDCGFNDQGECERQGCCWVPAQFGASLPYIDLPWCFRPNTGPSIYAATQVQHSGESPTPSQHHIAVGRQLQPLIYHMQGWNWQQLWNCDKPPTLSWAQM